MATIKAQALQSGLGSTANSVVSSSRRGGLSAKGRDKAIQQALSQTPVKEQPPGLDMTQASAAQGSMTQTKNLLQKRQKKPAYMQSLNEHEKAENFKIIDNMNKKISYKKNPRYKINKAPILFTQASNMALSLTDPKHPFRVEPPLVQFTDYQVNGVYEITLKITNSSQVCKRVKFLPPSTENFTMRNIKYPSSVTGDVAPGMSVTLSITFSAPSFGDFDDMLTVVTEETSFKVPLRARRDPPVISLVNPLDCLHSWIGDRVDMAFRCVNTGGDGGFKFFCERDEDDYKQTDSETIRLGSFTLTPSEFYLYSGNAIDIYVSFNPEREGQVDQNLILACDNQTSEFYKLTGFGAMLDLDIVEVDGRSIDFKKNPFETLFFDNTNPTSITKRKIKIKNSSPILVPFHWSVYKSKNIEKITLSDDQTHYRVEPVQGKIQAGQTQEFTFFFSPDHAEPYFEYVDLIVEDIPIQSIRNPPETLRTFALSAAQPKTRIPMPTYVGSNAQFMSIPLISMNLKGQGNSCEVFLDPQLLVFEGDMFINQTYTKSVKLKKDYDGIVYYKLRMEGKSSENLKVEVRAQGYQIVSEAHSADLGGIIESKIQSDKEIDIEIHLTCSECGDQSAFFYIEVQDGAPITFQCSGSFRGPTLKIIEPVVDFGLMKINSSSKFRVNIENTSPIPCEILVKSFKAKNVTFDSLSNSDSARSILTSEGNQLRLDRPTQLVPAGGRCEFLITLNAIRQETMEEYFEILAKDSDSSLFFQVMAEIQKPRVCLNRNKINLGKIYAGVQERVENDHKQAIVLRNYGNLPAAFSWEEKVDPERIVARFEPKRGVIPPKSEVKVAFTTTLYYGGVIDEVLVCNIDDLEVPLGFELAAESFGLNVSHEIAQDITSQKMNMTKTSSMNDTQTSHMHSTNAFNETMNNTSGTFGVNLTKLQRELEARQLKQLQFPNCKINKPISQKFILKNLSGIKTSFHFNSIEFEPVNHVAPSEKSEIQKAMEEAEAARQRAMNESVTSSMNEKSTPQKNGGKSIRFADVSNATRMNTLLKKSTTISDRRTKAILSDEHEQTQKFSSVTGNTFTQTKKIEKEQNFYLSNNKGIAIVFNPHVGHLPPHSEIPITVTIYNNVCGKFDDRIISNIKGLEPFEFPISIGISGSPIIIPVNQVGLNYKTTPPTLPMPCIVTNSQPIMKQFKLKNTGIRGIQVDWQIYDTKDLEHADQDLFETSVVRNHGFDSAENPYKFKFDVIEPEESKNTAFEVAPKRCVLGPREIQNFTVTFFSNKGIGEFKSIMMATPELSQDELEIAEEGDEFIRKGALGIISLNLFGETLNPELAIDKRPRHDGEHHMAFKYWSVPTDPDAPSATQKVIYTNNTKADMTFNLNINGPFEIVKTKSNTGAVHPLASTQSKISKKVDTMFCLQPLKIVEIEIKFKAPSPQNSEEWPMIIKNEREGELTAHFANGMQQKLILDAMLLRPMLLLLTEKPSKNDKAMDELDFGTVHIDKHRTVRLFLSNITTVTGRWKLNYVSFPKKSTVGYSTMTAWEAENMQKEDDPDVFEFSVTDGSLRGKTLPLRKLPEGLNALPIPKDDDERKFLPQTILVNFRPKKNVLYKSKFRFTVENGISCDVILKGFGSYEENHD